METNLVAEGFKFMWLGMGTVFVFLAIMILMMNVMSIVINKFFPEPKQSGNVAGNTKSNHNKVVAAITAAIKHHREG